MLLADLHIHSTFSDGKLSIPEIVDFYGSRGFKIIAITDHLCEVKTFLGKASKVLRKTLTKDSFQDYIDIIALESKRAMLQYGMLVIPGLELTKNSLSFNRSAHILGLGISQYIDADLDISDLIDEIHKQGGLAIAAHPVSTKKIEHQTYHLWDNRDLYKDKFDAWEVASGAHLFEEVLFSGLKMVASSDFHLEKHIDSWKTLIECDLNFNSMKNAIKEQKVEFTFYKERSLEVYFPKVSLSHIGASSGRSCPAV